MQVAEEKAQGGGWDITATIGPILSKQDGTFRRPRFPPKPAAPADVDGGTTTTTTTTTGRVSRENR